MDDFYWLEPVHVNNGSDQAERTNIPLRASSTDWPQPTLNLLFPVKLSGEETDKQAAVYGGIKPLAISSDSQTLTPIRVTRKAC